MAARPLKILAGAVAGLVAGAVIALGLCVAAAYAFDVSQAEGAYAMGVVFFYMPAGALIGALAGASLGARPARTADGS